MLKEKVHACVVFGQIADQLQHAFSPAVPTEKAADVEACVAKARSRPTGRHRPVLSRHFFL